MDRRTFNKLAGIAALEAVTNSRLAAKGRNQSEVLLEDDLLLAAFDAQTGALTRLAQKSPCWVIQRRPELGVSFRLLAPLPERRDNFVLGQKQKAASVEKISGQRLELIWKNLASEHGGVLPIALTATVTLENGALTFAAVLDNDSDLMVETIDYPYLGDLHPPAHDATVLARIMRYDDLQSDEIYPRFNNERGYWGVDFPTKTLDSCYSLFCLIQAPDRGLYVQMNDPASRYFLQYTFELHPGFVSGAMQDVPQEDEIDGIPVHTEFRTCHFLFVHPHSKAELAPVVLRPYPGDWHAGVDIYKQWRATWYKQARLPAWATDIHSWTEIQVNSPEEEYRIPYNQLAALGEECAQNGVTAIQLVGWNLGGQDRGNPSFDTDPRLGTWQELHGAIQKIQAMGVKIVLFGKFPWADMTTEWYKNELYKYASVDPYGIRYESAGDSYHTPTQLAGINNRRFAVMDFLSPEYRAIAVKEFEKILELSASGWLYDEVCVCVPGKYNFAAGHGYVPPRYIYAGNVPLGEEVHAAADRVNRDFLFAGEGPQDWLTQFYPFSYFRDSPTPGERYIDPHAPIMDAVTGFDDREELNLILLRRYIISYEPYNFKGRLSDFPLTLAYGKKIDALRRQYREYLWDGEFRDTLGADVSASGPHLYSVFVTTGGKRSVVVINQDRSERLTAKIQLPKAGKLVAVTPENPDAAPTDGTLEIPARCAAVVIEL
jgi:hypothetical protein